MGNVENLVQSVIAYLKDGVQMQPMSKTFYFSICLLPTPTCRASSLRL